MTSPARILTMSPPRDRASPAPSVTWRVWPRACECQALRAPGLKRTRLTRTREGSSPLATASTQTSPVNVSTGPLAVGGLGLISICFSFVWVSGEDLPASNRRLGGGTDPASVGGVDGCAGGHDLVDAVQHVAGELNVGGGELRLEMLHRPWANDRGRHRGVAEDERDRHFDQGHPRLVGQLRELLSGVELALVGQQRKVEAIGELPARLRSRGHQLGALAIAA